MKRAALALLLLCGAAALALDWRAVAAVHIPAGEVASVAVDGETVWTMPNPLPDGAVEIAYIEATGTQYINTGVSIASGKFQIHCAFTKSYSSTRHFFGVQGDATSGTSGQKRLLLWQTSSGYSIDRGAAGSRIAGTGNEPNTGEIAFSIVLNTAKSIHVFAANGLTTGNANRGIGRLFSLKLWDGSVLVRDFIPVRIDTTGYLYDRVSGELFGNSGTGAFVLGQDKE